MQAETLSDISRRGVELRYVTEHFDDLKGLLLAPLYAALLALVILAQVASAWRHELRWAFPALVPALYVWIRSISRWYARKYGVIQTPNRSVASHLVSLFHFPLHTRPEESTRSRRMFLFLLVAGLPVIPFLFGRHFSEAPATTYLLAMMVVPRCFSSTIPEWRVQFRRLLAVISLAGLSITYLWVVYREQGMWAWQTCLLTVLLMSSLYDHWLLTRLLPLRAEKKDRE